MKLADIEEIKDFYDKGFSGLNVIASGGIIGVLIKNSSKFLDHGRIVALQIIILIIGIGLDKLLTVIRKMLFPYSKFQEQMSAYVELETILYLDKVELSYGDNVILKM